MIQKTGHAYLHVDEHGASITPTKDRPDLETAKRRAGLTGSQSVKVDGGVEAHVHLHDGAQVRSVRAKTRGIVTDSTVAIRRAPQRTFSA